MRPIKIVIMGVTRIVVGTTVPVAARGAIVINSTCEQYYNATLNHPRSRLKRALSYCNETRLRIGASRSFSKDYENSDREKNEKNEKGEMQARVFVSTRFTLLISSLLHL